MRAAALLLVLTLPAAAQDKLPSPAMVIYPGDIISEAMLVDVDVRDLARAGGAVIDHRSALIGRAARRTLLPGAAISPAWVEAPRAVSHGATVKIVFEEGGLSIASSASALQAGAVGDTIRLRNPESGIIIAGAIQPDGSVRVRER